jgi:hypothetical protein
MESFDNSSNYYIEPEGMWEPEPQVTEYDASRERPWVDGYTDDGSDSFEVSGEHFFDQGYGLGVYETDDDMFLEITDPQQFTDAVAVLAPASVPAEEMKAESPYLIPSALRRASSIIFRREHATVTAFLNTVDGVPSNLDIHPAYHDQDLMPADDQQAYVSAFASEAGRLAEALRAIDAPATVVAALDELVVARQQGMLQEWAGLYMTRLLGHGDMQIGVDRMDQSQEWAQAVTILQRLRSLAPNSPFTELVRTTVTTDIEASLRQLSRAKGGAGSDSAAAAVLRKAIEQVEYALPDLALRRPASSPHSGYA